MSTEPHKFWPPVGSTWQHWSDLLLATQLAALRAGFNYVGRCYNPRSPNLLRMGCSVTPHAPRTTMCKSALLVAKAVDLEHPSGAWSVTQTTPVNYNAVRHPAHCAGVGLSFPLKKKSQPGDPLEAGDEIVGFRALHTLEGSIRADARRAGRFVTFGAIAGPRMASASTDEPDTAFNCVLRGSLCPFLVRLTRLDDTADDEPRWQCVEIRSAHTCTSDAAPPQKRLKRRLEYFPSISLHDGHLGKPMKQHRPRGHKKTTKCDEKLGPFPVRPRAEAPRPPSPELYDPAYRSPCPSPPLAARDRKKPEPPSPARTPPAPTSSRSPSPAAARAAPTQSPSPSPAPAPAPAAPAPAAPPPPPPLRTPSALLARRSASLASATAVLAALEQAIEVQRALVAKKRRSVERAAGKLEVRKKDKVQEVVKQVVKKPGPPRRSRAERKRLKQQREREARERGEAE